MPAEWEHHSGTLMAWPQNRETWPGDRLQRVEKVYAEIISTMIQYESVYLITHDNKTKRRAQRQLGNSSQIVYLDIPNNDVWTRDFGPVMVKSNSDLRILDWGYNSWGGKYPPYDADNAVPQKLSAYFKIPSVSIPMILEGGSIDVNGGGLLLTTESVLLNSNRNPHMSKAEISMQLKNFLGIEHIVWLAEGLEGDDTDGHIDDITRFVNEKTIFTCISHDKSDPNYDRLKRNHLILERFIATYHQTLELVEIPLPKTKIEGSTVDGSQYVPASYANFYFVNGALLVPTYDARYDDQVLDLFAKYLPNRKVIGIHCADLVWGQGSIHCITQQLYGLDVQK